MTLSEIQDRFPEMKERLADAAENLPDANVAAAGVGATLLLAGAVAGLASSLRGDRRTGARVLPIALATSGAALVGTALLRRRSTHIESAETAITAELDRLDPLARAQVIKRLAEEQVQRLLPKES